MDIDNNFLNEASKIFNKDTKNKLARDAVTATKLDNIIINRELLQKHNRIFSNTIKTKTSPSNQKRSGRCWLFAICNLIRIKMIEEYKLPAEFEVSQSYLFFYNILEKSNHFLHLITKFKDEETTSRMNYYLLSLPISDGGNWNMIVNLINKYGVVPKTSFNESFNTENTYYLNYFLSNKLRDYAFVIRNMENKEIPKFIEKCMKEVYRILVIFMGEPPSKISWEYLSNNKYKLIQDITPQEFYKNHVPFKINDYILLADNPLQKPYTNFTIDYFNNMKDGEIINYVNVPKEDIKKAIKLSLDSHDPLWFGCDVDKYLDKTNGILDLDMINYRNVFNTDITLNKKFRLEYMTSDVTHAMLLRGYDNQTIAKKICKEIIEKVPKSKSIRNKKLTIKSKKSITKSKKKTKKINKSKSKSKKQFGGSKKTQKKKVCPRTRYTSNNAITKYLVENSWGKNDNDENIVMTNEYFEEYCYIVAVHKKYLPNKIIKILKQKPIHLNLWDPFGDLLF